MFMRWIAVTVFLTVLATACSSAETTTTVPSEDSDSAAIYAVALHELVTDDNTFGGGGNPFSELLVLTALDAAAGAGYIREGSTGGIRPLSDGERSAIEAALSPLAPVRWIDDAAAWRTDEMMPVVEGSAILSVGSITFDGDGALVPMSMWCGGLCGTWFNYRVIQSDQGWIVAGIEGPIVVS